MSSFGELYSELYDSFYSGKNYEAESQYLKSLISRYKSKSVKSILELGCGTAGHAKFLLKEYQSSYTGVDLSGEMLKRAKVALNCYEERVSFVEGDIQEFELCETFDVVYSLFHVFSYLPDNFALESALTSVEKHLSKDGIFIFDFWSGPGVLNDRPTVRLKRGMANNTSALRISNPAVDFLKNQVKVSFETIVNDNGKYNSFKESHLMRYLFATEIEYVANKCGLSVVDIFGWNSLEPLNDEDWYGVAVCKKR